MIKFDISKLSVDHMRIKAISSALGGMMTVVDDKKSKKAKKESYSKIPIPHAVARSFVKKHVISKYIKPVLAAVTRYDGHVVAIERHPAGLLGQDKTTGLNGQERDWISDSEMNLDSVIMPLTSKETWYTDGTFIYTVPRVALNQAEQLSADGKFRAVKLSAVKFANIGLTKGNLALEERTALAYYADSGKMAMTPPIWKSLSEVGQKQISRNDHTGDDDKDYQFDKVDQFLSVNLGFALKAGKDISRVFGYDAIEPLALDNLMIQLRTVNLPNIDNAIKQSFDTGMPFTHAIAWLIGLGDRVETLESYVALRSLLKYLTTKGVYRKNAFTQEAVYKIGVDSTHVKLKTIEEAKNIGKIDLDTVMLATRIRRMKTTDTAGVLNDAH